MKQHNKKRGIVAGAFALVTAAALALGGAAAATAAPTILPDFTTANLHIQKLNTLAGGPGEAGNGLRAGQNGAPDIPLGAVGIAGVKFSAKRVSDINLSTNAGWQQAGKAALDLSGAVPAVRESSTPGAPELGTDAAVERTTDSNGELVFDDLPIGLYLVQETETPAGVTPSAPFMVALPLTDPSNQSNWLQDVYVYPKNSRIGVPVKTVNDATPFGTTDQQRISYTITADVPRNPGAAAGTFIDPTGYMVSDQLNGSLTPFTVTAEITGQPLVACDAVNPVPACDYEVTGVTAGAEVVVRFSDAGLAKMGDAASTVGAKVTVTIVADVVSTIASAGTPVAPVVIGNAARIYPDLASIETPGDAGPDQRWLDTNNVDTKWGTVSFTKVNQDGLGLENAEFKVATSKANAEANTFIRTAQVSSVADGAVTITGLRASNFANNVTQSLGAKSADDSQTFDVINASYAVYWLTETKAPANYELLAQPIPVALLADGSIRQLAQDANGDLSFSTATGEAVFANNVASGLEVVNVQKNAGFVLPLTGGMGTAFLTVIGLGIIGFVVVVARRRRNAEAAN